jgi:hypothetical protein
MLVAVVIVGRLLLGGDLAACGAMWVLTVTHFCTFHGYQLLEGHASVSAIATAPSKLTEHTPNDC